MDKRTHSDNSDTESDISSANYNDHLQELGGNLDTNWKFKQVRYQQAFVLQKLDSVADPSEILRHCFQKCIDRTMEESRSANMEADQIGMIISSPLLSYDIWTPMRPVTENTVDAILNFFKKVQQSHTDTNIYGEPFQVTVSGINSKALPRTRTTTGRGRKRFANIINRNVDDACIMEIKNEDQYCLFYALELMRIYVSKEMRHQRFSEYRRNIQKQEANVKQMMRKAKIPRRLPEYTLEEWGPVVQAYYDEEYGAGIVFIYIF